MKKSLLLLTCGVIFASAVAHADPVITVTPWLAPNAFGSPSFAAAVVNEQYAMSHGLSTYGAPGPTQYNAQSNVTADQAIVTNFYSWMGVAAPTGAYSTELGNRLTFGLMIVGNNTQFSISQLSFLASDTDGANYLGFSHAAGYYNYSTGYEGVQKGTDGILGTADDVYITSGPNTQLVDALYAQGNGNSFEADCTGCSTSDQQAAIADAAGFLKDPYTFTGTYSLGTDSGSGTFDISPAATSPVPEPSSLLLLGTGVAGLAGTIRRRFKK